MSTERPINLAETFSSQAVADARGDLHQILGEYPGIFTNPDKPVVVHQNVEAAVRAEMQNSEVKDKVATLRNNVTAAIARGGRAIVPADITGVALIRDAASTGDLLQIRYHDGNPNTQPFDVFGTIVYLPDGSMKIIHMDSLQAQARLHETKPLTDKEYQAVAEGKEVAIPNLHTVAAPLASQASTAVFTEHSGAVSAQTHLGATFVQKNEGSLAHNAMIAAKDEYGRPVEQHHFGEHALRINQSAIYSAKTPGDRELIPVPMDEVVIAAGKGKRGVFFVLDSILVDGPAAQQGRLEFLENVFARSPEGKELMNGVAMLQVLKNREGKLQRADVRDEIRSELETIVQAAEDTTRD